MLRIDLRVAKEIWENEAKRFPKLSDTLFKYIENHPKLPELSAILKCATVCVTTTVYKIIEWLLYGYNNEI